MVAGRIGLTPHFVDDFAAKAPNGLESELKRFHYDIAGAADCSAMSALMNLVPTSRIVFGSDYPILPIGATAGGLAGLGLPAGERRAIGRENAAALFPRWKRT